jgi:hypothetical protein
MYAASVPLFRQMLFSLAKVLEKGALFAEAGKIEPSALLQSRLAPDMFPLVRQVQSASDNVKGGVGRLAGVEIPRFADNEASFADLHERIARTLGFLDTVTPAQIDGSEDREITLRLGGRDMTFAGQRYLFGFVMPNVIFHCTTAYDILRHNGVELGKRDFIGTF